MILLLCLSILFITYLGITFKLFPKYKIDAFQAITINYVVCIITGYLFAGHALSINSIIAAPWGWSALVVGTIFITTFYLIAKTVEFYGLTIATIMQKMTLVVTTVFAIWVYSESTTLGKVIGITLACIALILTNYNKTDSINTKKLFYPILTFLFTAIAESILLYTEKSILGESGNPLFVTGLFTTSAIIGCIVLGIQLIRQKAKLKIKNLIAGIALGIPNYFSLYFLMKALGSGLEGSVSLPVINISVIVLSTLISIVFFRERLKTINYIGIALCIISILLITTAL